MMEQSNLQRKNSVKENIQNLINSNELDSALLVINKFLEVVSDDADMVTLKGVVSLMRGDFEEALSYFLESRKIEPNNIDNLYNLAYVFKQMDQYEGAYQCYQIILNETQDLSLKQEVVALIEELNRTPIIEMKKNEDQSLVSVCIPVYNGENYIKYTIDSVINQSYKNLEIIICDNSSTDQTIQIVNSYNDKRIKLYINETNKGYTYNLNKCIELSKGEYLKFIFADDLLHENCIEEMVKVMNNNIDVNLCAVNFVHINNENIVLSEPIINMTSKKYESNQMFKELIVIGNVIGCPSGVMIRMETVRLIGSFSTNMEYMEDYEFWIRICKQGNYYFINEVYMYYRIGDHSGTNQKISTIIRVRDFYNILEWYLDNEIFTQNEIEIAYVNANNRSYYSLEMNDNKSEKIEIIEYILNNSKFIPLDEKNQLVKFKDSLCEDCISD